MPTVLSNVRFQVAGRDLLTLSSSQFDPERTLVSAACMSLQSSNAVPVSICVARPSGHAGISMAFFVRFLSFPRLSRAVNSGYRLCIRFLWRHIMSASDTVLMVIDVQESFRQRQFWSDADCPAFIKRLQKLVRGANAQTIPVLQLFHITDP